MATIAHDKYASPSFQGNYDVFGVGPGDGGRWFGFTLDVTAPVTGDLWNFVKLSKDTIVMDAVLQHDALSASGLVVDVGIEGGDVDLFIDAVTVTTAGVKRPTANIVPSFEGDDYMVQGVCSGTIGTPAAGTVTLYLQLANVNAN